MNIYQKNLSALKKINPNLAQKLSEIKTNQTFEVFASDNLNNANILDLRDSIPLHLNNPIDEIDDKLNHFKQLEQYPYLYFFGIGNGYFYKKFLQNNKHKRLYIIEPEIEMVYIALNLVDISKEIKTRKINLLTIDEVKFASIQELFDSNEKLYFKVYNLDIYSPYYEKYYDEIVKTNEIFLEVFKHFINATGNDCTDELNGLSYFLQNMPLMLKNPSLKNLTTKGKTTDTCIIVATGPSLAKQLPLLKKIQDHVTIISADSSLPILYKEGITPDITTTIERHPLLSEYYKNTPQEFLKKIVISLTSVVHADLLEAVKGLNLQLNMRPTGSYYKYFEFHDWGYIGEGMSTANMAYELASKMDFKRIVLIGQDLSYADDGSSHPKGHIFGTNNHADNAEAGTLIEAYGGEGKVKTMLHWKLFLNGYVKAVNHNNKYTDTITINSTEGGARIAGTIEMALQDVIDKYIDMSRKKEKISLDYPTESEYQKNLEIAINKLDNINSIGLSMQKRIEKQLKINTDFAEKHKEINISNIKQYKKQINTMLNNVVDIRKKYYNDSFGFFNHLLSPLVMHIEYDLAKVSVLPENSEEEKLMKNWKMILTNHELFFRVLINTEAVLKIINEKKPLLEKSLENELEIA